MIIKIAQLALALSMSFYSLESSAQIFDIKVTDYDGADSYPALKALIDTELAKVVADINKDLPGGPPDRLMEGMANSSVMAGKGIGTDYASNMKVMIIGAGIGVGADLAKDKTTDSDLSGAGVAPGIMMGMNLGFMDSERFLGMDTDRLNMYVNFMSYNYKYDTKDKENPTNIDLGMTAAGVHFRYDWIKPRGNKLLGWGGVKFNFGYEYNKTDIVLNSSINETVNTTDSGATINGTITGSPQATIMSTTHSIPLALSTDVQLLYFLTLYTGMGVDVNFGKAEGRGNLNAQESTISCSSGVTCTAASNPDIKVQASADINGNGAVNPFLFRGFAGLQINLPFIRIFGQVDKAVGNDLIGATAGVRFVY